MSTSSSTQPNCIIDRKVLNAETVGELEDIGLSIFAPLCGRNRGAFVLSPSDQQTYGCTAFPANFGALVGLAEPDLEIKDANAVKEIMDDGNTTSKEVVDMIDYLTQAVYASSPDVDKDVYACNVGGLALLECGDSGKAEKPIRSATLAGLFVDALWATGGKALTEEEATAFYTSQDFADMKALGLNTVQIPFHTKHFQDSAKQELLTATLSLVSDAGLDAILMLVGDDDVAAAATYASTNNNAVMGIILPSMDSYKPARQVSPEMKIFIPVNGGDLTEIEFPADDENVFAAMDMDHSTNIPDIASSDSTNDRMKLFYHEGLACIKRSPLEFLQCYKGVGAYVYQGFDLSIDNCASKVYSDTFIDYGQCDRLNETLTSGWWLAHRQSFAAKQMFSYEQGLGWSFSAWKLYESDSTETINSAAHLLSLQNVAAAGLLSLDSTPENACLNPPKADFTLGDDTLAPSPSPPPDCGNGWWNFTTAECDYWIPPTAAPIVPCPECEECTECPSVPMCEICPSTSNAALAQAAAGGGVVALLVGFLALKLFGGNRGGGGYSTIPNANGNTLNV